MLHKKALVLFLPLRHLRLCNIGLTRYILLYNTCLLLLMSFYLASWTQKLNAYLSVQVLTRLVQPGLTRKVINLSTQNHTCFGKLPNWVTPSTSFVQ